MREKNLFFAGGQNLPPVVNLLQEARVSIYHNKREKTCTESRRKEPRKRINHNKRGFGQTTGKSRFSSKLLVDCNTQVFCFSLSWVPSFVRIHLQEICIIDVPCNPFLVLIYVKMNKSKTQKIDYRKATFALAFVQ